MSHVEVDEVFGFVSDIGSEVSTNNTMPGGVVFLVKLFLDVGGDILLDVELLQGNISAINGILLHLLVHIGMLDDGLPLCG